MTGRFRELRPGRCRQECRHGRLKACATVLMWAAGAVRGQTFEAASVRENRSGDRGSVEFSKAGDRFTAVHMGLGPLILIAYDTTVRQISAPAGLPRGTYDITAKAEHPVGREEMLRMLQALLAERFKLVVRRET